MYKDDKVTVGMFISVVGFVSRCAFFMPSVGSSVAIAIAAASTCLVPDIGWVLITCLKSLLSLFGVTRLVAEPTPENSECLDERIEILPETETVEENLTEVRAERTVWPWERLIRDLVDREDALLDGVAPVLPSTTAQQETLPDLRNPQAEGLLPGGRLV